VNGEAAVVKTAGTEAIAFPGPCCAAARGFTLIGLLIIIAISSIMLLAAFPVWTTIMQREKEAELIFRGESYQYALENFFNNFGRLPQDLTELVEMEPRSIRKLYPDPMTDDGEWELVKAGVDAFRKERDRGRKRGSRGARRRRSSRHSGPSLSDTRYRLPGRASNVKMKGGFISGVKSKCKDESIRLYKGADTYDQWEFTAKISRSAVGPGGRRGPGGRLGRSHPSRGRLGSRPGSPGGKSPYSPSSGFGRPPGRSRGTQPFSSPNRPGSFGRGSDSFERRR
jgi:type II secretory pathway pseudopilin PulG